METALQIALSKQTALRTNMDLIANNLANMNTPGYRAQNIVFKEFLNNPNQSDISYSQVDDFGQYQVTQSGPMQQTGAQLDAALVGPGFFGVTTPDGIQYTRAGNFTLDQDGTLLTATGLPVASDGGGVITIPDDAIDITISEDGTVSINDNQAIGKLMIAEFPDQQAMVQTGSGLYNSDDAPLPAIETTVLQGRIEGSNVDPVLEMTKMIKILRTYQSVQGFLQSDHDRQQKTIERLSRPA